jgi:stage V sporulation protein AE
MILKVLLAFLFGGFICVVAQILIDKTKLTPARILVCYVVFGVFLGAIGVYKPLFETFGCGISIPLIGFGGNIATGVREAVDNEGFLGVLKGSLSASSAGLTLALLLGLISSLFSKGKSKNL